ncbi:hypothetical protein HDU80_007963 [Chytriomyces hyalinus]|nr:hypothetical protein HDU80_007963 [Chytriomyces hyalinus]
MPEDIQDMQSYVKDLAKKVDTLQGAVSSLQAKNQVLETTNIQLSEQMRRIAVALSNEAHIQREGAEMTAFDITNNGPGVITASVDLGDSQVIPAGGCMNVGLNLEPKRTYMLTIKNPETHQTHILFTQPRKCKWDGFVEDPRLPMLPLLKQLTNSQADITVGDEQAPDQVFHQFENKSYYPVSVSINQANSEQVAPGESTHFRSSGASLVVMVIRDVEATFLPYTMDPPVISYSMASPTWPKVLQRLTPACTVPWIK